MHENTLRLSTRFSNSLAFLKLSAGNTNNPAKSPVLELTFDALGC